MQTLFLLSCKSLLVGESVPNKALYRLLLKEDCHDDHGHIVRVALTKWIQMKGRSREEGNVCRRQRCEEYLTIIYRAAENNEANAEFIGAEVNMVGL